MICLRGFIILALCSATMAYLTSNTCSAKPVENSYGAESRDCYVPYSTFNGPPLPTVTKPATIKTVKIDWFLDNNGNPGLNVTLTSLVPNSAQVYSINVMSGGFIYPTYCGDLSTAKPSGYVLPRLQTISLEITCMQSSLSPDKNVFVAIGIKDGVEQQVQQIQRRVTVPGCKDELMKKSNFCIAEEKKIVSFTLQQDKNSTIVILDPKTAYPKPTSKLYLTISKRNESALGNWSPVGLIKTLKFFQRTIKFTGLEMGATYRVCVWRPEDLSKRYTKIITLRPDTKEKATFRQ